MKKLLGRDRVCFWPLGFLFVLATALGIRLDVCDRTGWDGLLLCFGAALVLGPLLGEGFWWLARLLCRERKPVTLSRRRAFWLSLITLLLCWLPVVLAFYPGINGYDVHNQARQIHSGEYTTNHPLLHTLLMGGLMQLFGDTEGYGLYTLLQTALLALSMAYAMGCLAGMKTPRWLWILLQIFFCIAPQHGVMAASGTKDVLFAAALLTLVMELLRLHREPERQTKPLVWLWLLLITVLVGLLRKVAVYGVALLALALLIFGRRRLGHKLPVCMLCAALLAFGVNAGMKAAVNAQSPGLTGEEACIPCQQLGRVVTLCDIDPAEREWILQRVPQAENYVPHLADPAKQYVRFLYQPRNILSFIKLWGMEGLRHPIEYIDAFLLTSRGYWDVGDESFTTIYDYQPNEAKGVLMLRHVQDTGIEERSLLPGLKALWKRLFADNEYKRIPLVGLLLHPAVFTWLMAFLFVCTLWKGQRRLALLFGAILAETILKCFGPCCLIRYQYDLMLIAPVLLGALPALAKEEP